MMTTRQLALVPALACAMAGCAQIFGLNFDGTPAPPDAAIADAAADDAGDGDAGKSPFTIVQQFPGGAALNAIWGADANHVIAVGTDGTSYVYLSGAWTKLGGTEGGHDYTSVWGRSATEVYAVGAVANGGGGFVSRFDGIEWTDVFKTPAGLYGVWGSISENAIIAVGAKGAIYASHDGRTWTDAGTLPANTDVDAGPNDPILWGISGRSFFDFGIAAGKDRIFHSESDDAGSYGFANYDPALDTTISFRSVCQVPGPTTSLFFGTNRWGLAWFTGPGIVVSDASVLSGGAGTAQMVEIMRDDRTPGSAEKYIQGLWSTPDTVVAVGDDGRIYTYAVGPSEVVRVPSPTDAPLGGVWGSSLDDVWIVGDRELIMHGSLAR